MTSPILGEFLGTMMLVLLGNGVVAGVLLKRSKAEGGGWPVIAAGWAFAVMAGALTAPPFGGYTGRLAPGGSAGGGVARCGLCGDGALPRGPSPLGQPRPRLRSPP